MSYMYASNPDSPPASKQLSDTKAATSRVKNLEKVLVKVKVLGSAQDGGLPQIGCEKAHCQRAWKHPQYKRLVTSLAILDLTNQKVFLVDATPDIREQVHMIQTDGDLKLRKGKNPFDGILLTHAHIGHYSGLVHLGFEAISTKELPVFCTEKMANFLKANGPWSQLVDFKNIVLNEIQLDQIVQITPHITISAIPVPHRDEFSDTVGFMIRGPRKQLLYIPDIDHWKKWHRSLKELLQQVDIALLDGTFYSAEELPNRDISKIQHPLITDTVALLQDFVKTHPVKIYFTHLNHTNLVFDEDGVKRRFIESNGFFIAEEGMEFEL
ncbi:MAG: MBL fold metallo-hydrolase [bacterium]